MALVIGNNIIIKINSVDNTQYILSYTESGGKKIINKTKTYGNNYVTTVTGRENYLVSLEFKYDTDLVMSTLFESDTPITIEITTGSKKVTYNNAIPSNQTFTMVKDDIVSVKIDYDIAAADANTYNKGVA